PKQIPLPQQSFPAIFDLSSLINTPPLPAAFNNISHHEAFALNEYWTIAHIGFEVLSSFPKKTFDLSKPPESFFEATHRPDSEVWWSAMH
ncbi:hypothetical protein C0991_003263, partial [Blastosporella zonata]